MGWEFGEEGLNKEFARLLEREGDFA